MNQAALVNFQRFIQCFLLEQAGSNPFFGFLFYDSPHGKDSPEEMSQFSPVWETVGYLALDNDFNLPPYYNRYRNAVFYVDARSVKYLIRLKYKV